MDNQWILDALEGILPEQTVQLLHDHVIRPNTPFQIFKRLALTRIQQAYELVMRPLLDRGLALLYDSPDFVVFGALLAFIVLAVQVALWAHRVVMFWTRLAMRLVMWAVVFGVLAVIWQRGPEAAVRDVVVFFSKLAGYAAIVKEIWLREYDRYSAQATNAHRGKRGGGEQSRTRW